MQQFDGRYENLRELGEGGYGTVYLAIDRSPGGGRVALKRLSLAASKEPLLAGSFDREFAALRRFDFAGVPAAYEKGTSLGTPYFTMEYVRGRSLVDLVKEGRAGWTEKLLVVARAALVLGRVHESGVVHGDLKPENILVGRSSRVSLVDFGTCRIAGGAPLPGEDDVLVGTPCYLAPEIVELGALARSAKSDLFALGVILYEVLTGRLPFDGKSQTCVLQEIERGDALPPELVTPDVPGWLSDLAVSALARDPEERPRSADAFANEIVRALDPAAGRREKRALRSIAAA